MATWRITPIMVATVDRGRIARVIASPRVCMCHSYVLLLVDAWRLRLRDRDPSRDQSATIYFLRGDACRPFLFLSGATGWNKQRRVSEDVSIAPAAKAIYRYVLHLSGASKNAESDSRVGFGALNTRSCVFYPRLLLRVARACIIIPSSASRSRRIEWRASGRCSILFSCFWSARHITCIYLLCYKNINTLKTRLSESGEHDVRIPRELWHESHLLCGSR